MGAYLKQLRNRPSTVKSCYTPSLRSAIHPFQLSTVVQRLIKRDIEDWKPRTIVCNIVDY